MKYTSKIYAKWLKSKSSIGMKWYDFLFKLLPAEIAELSFKAGYEEGIKTSFKLRKVAEYVHEAAVTTTPSITDDDLNEAVKTLEKVLYPDGYIRTD